MPRTGCAMLQPKPKWAMWFCVQWPAVDASESDTVPMHRRKEDLTRSAWTNDCQPQEGDILRTIKKHPKKKKSSATDIKMYSLRTVFHFNVLQERMLEKERSWAELTRREFWRISTLSRAGELPLHHLSREQRYQLRGSPATSLSAGLGIRSSHCSTGHICERQHRPEQWRLRCARPAQWSTEPSQRFFLNHLGSAQAVLSTGGSWWSKFSNVHESLFKILQLGCYTECDKHSQ